MPLDDPTQLAATLQSTRREYADGEIERPASWGGYRLAPVHVELLEFREDRLHVRTCYTRVGGFWKLGYLQP
jgi:pyridoxamine 5'-phosphate oxidase